MVSYLILIPYNYFIREILTEIYYLKRSVYEKLEFVRNGEYVTIDQIIPQLNGLLRLLSTVSLNDTTFK
jgi:hypothetical protein